MLTNECLGVGCETPVPHRGPSQHGSGYCGSCARYRSERAKRIRRIRNLLHQLQLAVQLTRKFIGEEDRIAGIAQKDRMDERYPLLMQTAKRLEVQLVYMAEEMAVTMLKHHTKNSD